MTDGLGLGGAYGATLARIVGQGGRKARLGMATLMWICHSERPLRAAELCHALAVEIGSPNFNTDNVPTIGTLLACCQGLVAVDKESSTVRLIHFTLQEYLRAHPELFGSAHSTMAETCLSYLNSQQARALSPSSSPNPQDTPFLEYCSLYWGIHSRRDLSVCARSLALKLFDDFNNHISIKILLKAQKLSAFYRIDFDKLFVFNGLHCASILGIGEIVAGLIEVKGCDINQRDCMGMTPLVWAALNGHEGVAKILLGRGDVDPDRPDESSRTPLWWAACNGHEVVVKILLRRDHVNPDRPDMCGRIPLFLAAWNGHEGVAKLLLGRDGVSPDKPDEFGKTPFWWAAHDGHEGMVKILLGRDDVHPDKPDAGGRTPFWWAARNGHEGVVKILLGRDEVDPNRPDKSGRTPLWWAARNGHEGVVNILLGRGDVNPDKPDEFSQAPLWGAACNGHEGVVKILLGRGDVDPDRPDKYGRTPLWWATENSHTGVVALLQAPSTTHRAA